MKIKYTINKEFFPYYYFTPPFGNTKVAGWLGSMMRTPRWIWHDKEIKVRKEQIKGYQNADIDILIFEPRSASVILPCLVYYHGGGFMTEGSGYHFKLIKEYVLKTPCKVVFARYRLVPKNPHPIPVEDAYAGLCWTFENAERLNIDRKRIAVGGDSAGGTLSAAVCHMARDRGTDIPYFQLLIYPATDRRMETESNEKYTDTPMWNSNLSRKMWPSYITNSECEDIIYASPMEAEHFDGLPQAYIETAEFDCLHDEGIAYAQALKGAGVDVEINETKGTMHGFDIALNAPTTKAAVEARIQYMQKRFY